MKKQNSSVSVVVPVFNEGKVIKRVLSGIKKALRKHRIRFEIIVVNDGSTDSSGKILEKEKRITALTHSRNRGYGAAIKTGVRAAKFENIIVIDGDGTYSPEDIALLVKNFKDQEMVVGMRVSKESNELFLRKIMKSILTLLASYLVGEKIPDLNSGLRIFKKGRFIQFFHLLPSGFSLTSTITLAFLANNYSIKFIPIEYYPRIGKSKIKPIKDTFNFLSLILTTVVYFNPLRVFIPLGMFFFFFSFLVASYSFFFLPKFLDTTTVVLFVAGFQIFSIGILADLISKTNSRLSRHQ